MKSEIARTASGPIEYTARGDGPAVLVCHGTSSDCFSAEVGRPLLDAGFRVITPSRPGYGRTPLSIGRTADEAAQGLVALLDTLGVAHCAVVAVSGGGPTGLALAASCPDRVRRLVLAEAISHPEDRPNEPSYRNQVVFYGPLHSLLWGMLGLISRVSPRSMARQTLEIFSTHDPDDAMRRLSRDDIRAISRFYLGHSFSSGRAERFRTRGRPEPAKRHLPADACHSQQGGQVCTLRSCGVVAAAYPPSGAVRGGRHRALLLDGAGL